MLYIYICIHKHIYIYTHIHVCVIYIRLETSSSCSWLENKPITGLILLAYAWNTEGYGIPCYEFEYMALANNTTILREAVITYFEPWHAMCPQSMQMWYVEAMLVFVKESPVCSGYIFVTHDTAYRPFRSEFAVQRDFIWPTCRKVASIGSSRMVFEDVVFDKNSRSCQ